MARRSAIAKELRETLGERGYRALVKRFGGRPIYVPAAVRADPEVLRQSILRECACRCGDAEHHSYRAVARRLGVSAATVYRYANTELP